MNVIKHATDAWLVTFVVATNYKVVTSNDIIISKIAVISNWNGAGKAKNGLQVTFTRNACEVTPLLHKSSEPTTAFCTV